MRLLLDSTVLINGVFAPLSASRQLLDLIKRGAITAYVSQNTFEEVSRVLRRAWQKTGVDLRTSFNATSHYLNLFVLPRLNTSHGKAYLKIKGKADQVLAAQAAKSSLTICTNDLRDFKNASSYNLTVRSPLDIVRELDPSISTICLGNLATHIEGTFFIRWSPLWSSSHFKRQDITFYLFEGLPIGGLGYNTANKSLVIKGGDVPPLELKIGDVDRDETLSIIITYLHTKGITLYFGYRGKQCSKHMTWHPNPIPPSSEIRIDGNRSGGGSLALFTSLPIRLSETECNNLFKHHTTPHPHDRLDIIDLIHMLYT